MSHSAMQLEGWLSKRGKDFGERWLPRWFVLQGNILTYSKDERGVPDGRIELSHEMDVRAISGPNATVEGRVMKKKHPFALEILQDKGGRVWYLDAGNQPKLDIWIQHISGELDKLRAQARPFPGSAYGAPGAHAPCSAPGAPYGYGPPCSAHGRHGPQSGYGPPTGMSHSPHY